MCADKKAILFFGIAAFCYGMAIGGPVPPYGDPPYGLRSVSSTPALGNKGIYPEPLKSELNTIAKHYGFVDANDAYRKCESFRLKSLDPVVRTDYLGCDIDPISFVRDQSTDIKKYGFRNWLSATRACEVGRERIHPHGKTNEINNACFADPFQYINK